MDSLNRIQFVAPDLNALTNSHTVVDLHFHSQFSDGADTVEARARVVDGYSGEEGAFTLELTCETCTDADGDGYQDVLVGARFWDNGQTDEGGAFL